MSTVAALASSGLRKRSMAIAGHRTSIALEGVFWDALEQLAKVEGQTLAALIAAIDAERAQTAPDQPLASTLRVCALEAALRGAITAVA